MPELSPALELAVSLLAEGQSIPAYLCCDVPKSVADIQRVRMGHGLISGNGGTITVERTAWCRCIAYDVKGQLVTSQTTTMPVKLQKSVKAKVGPLALGKNGVPHK